MGIILLLNRIMQLVILLFTMILMLSKSYPFFSDLFSFFYESSFSLVCVILGFYSILHGVALLISSLIIDRNWKIVFESIVLMLCGVLLISPIFNSFFVLPFLSGLKVIPEEIISHLAFALLPLIFLNIVWIFLRK